MPKTTFDGLTLSDSQAYALAQLCKRICWEAVRDLACNTEQAYEMLAACDVLSEVLAKEGYQPR